MSDSTRDLTEKYPGVLSQLVFSSYQHRSRPFTLWTITHDGGPETGSRNRGTGESDGVGRHTYAFRTTTFDLLRLEVF